MQACSTMNIKDLPLAEINMQMGRAARNKLWVMNNMTDLRKKYGDKYVACDDGQIIAAGDTSEEVLRTLRKKRVSSLAVIALEFVPKDLIIWLL